VDLVESFSLRSGPPETAAADRWVFDALAAAFDQAG
jgi:hypothetical protein